jgi:CheY-like chemotaxis protein
MRADQKITTHHPNRRRPRSRLNGVLLNRHLSMRAPTQSAAPKPAKFVWHSMHLTSRRIADHSLLRLNGGGCYCAKRGHMIRPRVLLADDHPAFILAIGRLLAPDYEVVGSVKDGARLLEEAVRLQPDVIVLDLNMPSMNGIHACRELRRMIPRTRIVVLTAEDDAVVRQVVLAAGASAFVEKQVVGTDLLPAVRVACGGQQM